MVPVLLPALLAASLGAQGVLQAFVLCLATYGHVALEVAAGLGSAVEPSLWPLGEHHPPRHVDVVVYSRAGEELQGASAVPKRGSPASRRRRSGHTFVLPLPGILPQGSVVRVVFH